MPSYIDALLGGLVGCRRERVRGNLALCINMCEENKVIIWYAAKKEGGKIEEL